MTPGIALLVIGGILLVSGWTGSGIVDTFSGKRDNNFGGGNSGNGSDGSNGTHVPVPGSGAPLPGSRSGFSFPFGSAFGWGRTDQGVDFTGSGPIHAIGDATLVRVDPQGSGTGWPGQAGKGTGSMLVYKLDKKPPMAGASQYIYLAENVDPVPGLIKGARIKAGEVIAHARGGYPFLETGFAQDEHGTPLTPYNSSDYEKATPGGDLFRRFLNWLHPTPNHGPH